MFPALWGFLTPLVHNTPLKYIAETVEVIDNVRDVLDFASFSRLWPSIERTSMSPPTTPGSVSSSSSTTAQSEGSLSTTGHHKSGAPLQSSLLSMPSLTRISLVPDANNAHFHLSTDHLLAFPPTLKLLKLKCVGAMASFYNDAVVQSYLQDPTDVAHPIHQMNTWTDMAPDTKSTILSAGVALGDFAAMWPSLESLHLTETCDEYPKLASPMMVLFPASLTEICLSKIEWTTCVFLPPSTVTLRLSTTYPKPAMLLTGLPQHLNKLSLDVDPLTLQEVQTLPSALKTLNVRYGFTEEMFAYLPLQLSSLGIDMTFVTAASLAQLPPTITHLTFFGAEVPAVAGLPRSLNTVSFRHPQAHVDVGQLSNFPKRLRWIEMHRQALLVNSNSPIANAAGFTLIRRR